MLGDVFENFYLLMEAWRVSKNEAKGPNTELNQSAKGFICISLPNHADSMRKPRALLGNVPVLPSLSLCASRKSFEISMPMLSFVIIVMSYACRASLRACVSVQASCEDGG